MAELMLSRAASTTSVDVEPASDGDRTRRSE